MSNFSEVVKYLDLDRAARDTTLVTDRLLLHKARAIKKVQDTLTLPVTLVNSGLLRLAFQYNVTVGYEFSLDTSLVAGLISPMKNASLFIKWREGSTVFRYRIAEVGGSRILDFLHLEDYAGQRIKSNCCFECRGYSFAGINIGIEHPLSFKLSRLRNPNDPEDTGTGTTLTNLHLLATLGVALPETLPYTQDNQVWLNN